LLESQSHAAPWTAGNFRDALAAGYSTIVGDADGVVVAYGVLMLAPGEAQVLNLTVAPHARRQGLARALLQRFLDDALRLGADQCFLEVRASNAAATARYAQAGFVPVARRAGYYPPRREDATREAARGAPLVGQAGRLLDNMLLALGVARGQRVYIANVLKCRPPGNRTPSPLEAEACRPYLDRQIALIQPKVIVALGKSAATTLLN